MVVERSRKYPFIFFFIIYLLKYQLVWTLTTIFISYIPYYVKGGNWSLLAYYYSWFKDMTLVCCFGTMPIFAPYVYYYQCFSMIRRIEIDENSKTLKVEYMRFFFWRKNKEYFLDDPTFTCSVSNTKHSFITRLFFPHFNMVIEFNDSTDKAHPFILLKDRCGWEQKQLTEILRTLTMYCPCDYYIAEDKTDS